MLTIQELADYGANVEEGLRRCMNNESFYLRLVGIAAADEGFDRLAAQIEAGALEEAFDSAHALKGVLGNLFLTPLYEPVSEVTELLRAKKEADYAPLVSQILERRDRLKELLA
ncbi:MAG: Hpt domain-containing protein [Eubacteriales bacterium]|nr:Hpt domain-containing protein [Eubacteriales bacterium]